MLSWTWPVTHISSTRRVEITSLDDCQLSPLTSAERLQSLWEPLPHAALPLPASCFLSLPSAQSGAQGEEWDSHR